MCGLREVLDWVMDQKFFIAAAFSHLRRDPHHKLLPEKHIFLIGSGTGFRLANAEIRRAAVRATWEAR